MTLAKHNQVIEHHELAPLLPFRAPWLLIDRVLQWETGKLIVTQKCLTASDPLVAAHLGDGPRIIPGVLLIELVGQSAYLLARLSDDITEMHLLARCRAQFLAPAMAGDILTARVNYQDTVQGIAVYEGVVSVGDRDVCRAQSMGVPISKVKSS
jgi:3-hydroxyacyl-[acyl-carrier-protein] dehydratase